MNKSKTVSRRVRPLLGTFFEITTDAASSVINSAFAEAERLEKIFNLCDPQSEINSHGESSSEFIEVQTLALHLEAVSGGAFRAKKNGTFDFNGIAKGYIVDRTVKFLRAHDKFCSGSVNAGGDLLLFNHPPKNITLRLGTPSLPVYRELQIFNKAVATSAGGFSGLSGSLTSYDEKSTLTATVVAPSCILADALTKVALFAEASILERCTREFGAHILLFDDFGGLVNRYGENETQ